MFPSVFDLATLAHGEMSRVRPDDAMAEHDDEDQLEAILDADHLSEEPSGTSQLFFARLDRIEERQRTHEAYLKQILAAVSKG